MIKILIIATILVICPTVAHSDHMADTFEELMKLVEMTEFVVEGAVIDKAGNNDGVDHFITLKREGTNIGVIRRDDGKNTHYWEEIV